MNGWDLGGIAALLVAPVFAEPSVSIAERQYREARVLETKGDEKGALAAYLRAGEAGHGLAQKRLGEIYERGNSATRRDYDAALRWYEKARAQGIAIPKPFNFQKGYK